MKPRLEVRRDRLAVILLMVPLAMLGLGLIWRHQGGDDAALWAWAAGRWQAGLSAEWCAGLLLGYPLADAGPINLLYPPLRLLRHLGADLQAFYALGHVMVLGLGAYALARTFKLRRRICGLAALAAAAAVPFSPGGTLMGGLAWLPWLLLGIRRLATLPAGPQGLAGAALAGAAGGLLLAAGERVIYAPAAVLAAVGLFGWALVSRPAGLSERRVLGRAGVMLALALLIGAGRVAGLARFERQAVALPNYQKPLFPLADPKPGTGPFGATLSAGPEPMSAQRVLGYGEGELPRGSDGGLLRLDGLASDNRSLAWGLDSLRGRLPKVLARTLPFPAGLQDRGDEAPAVGKALGPWTNLLDRAGVRWLFSAEPVDLPGLRLLRSDGVHAYERKGALPLARFAARVGRVGSAESALRSAAALPAAATDLVEGSLEPLPAPAAADDRLQLSTREDGEWRLHCAASGPRLLVLAMAYYEGAWQGELDGQPWPIVPVDGVFCGLALPAGDHRVRIHYQDPYQMPGRAAQALGLALALLILLLPVFQKRGSRG